MFFGYIDPGSGSLFIQALIGVVVAGAFIFRNFFWKVIGFLTKPFKSHDDTKASDAKDAKNSKSDKK